MNNNYKKVVITGVVATLLLVVVMFVMVFAQIHSMNNRITTLEEKLQNREEVENSILEHLKGIREDQEEIKRINQERLELEKKRSKSISGLQAFNIYTDLKAHSDLTAEDMDKIIDQYANATRFHGKGYAFIEASKATGFNPVYILAHAALESAWGNSYIARTKNNFFGINCIDSNPDAGYTMGDNVVDGLIAGAKWIDKNYYDQGYTTLADMIQGNYASDMGWAHKISSIVNTSARML